jgi:hypothetical protein
MNKATDADIVRWQLRFIKENSDKLTEGEMKIIISFEEQFNRKGFLTNNQMPILEEIYKRRT